MQLERDQINELNRERDEFHTQLIEDAFKEDAVKRIRECLTNGGDISDLIVILNSEFSDYDCMEYADVNQMIIDACMGMV